MSPEPRRAGLPKLIHKARNLRSGKAYRAARRTAARLRGKPVAHFLHVRKAGGSAVKTALDPWRSAGPQLIELHPHRITIRDIPRGESAFFIVRDPVSRFVSGFYSRQRRGLPAHDIPWSDAERDVFERYASANALGLALASNDPARCDPARAAMASLRHVNSSYWDWFIDEPTLRDRAGDVLMVARQDRLADDFARLRDRLGLPAHVALPTDPASTNQGGQSEDRRLDPAAHAAIAEHYHADYRFLELCGELGLLPDDEPAPQ